MNALEQVKRVLDIAYRRRWWLVVPVAISVAVGIAVLSRLPRMYQASTSILVTAQRLPEEFVRSTVTTRVEERMTSLSVQLLSRRYLETVVAEFGLASPQDGDRAIEQASSKLRRRVTLDYDRRNLSWFKINVEDELADRAAGIANRLADLFIEQNSRLREEQAAGTLETVEGWLRKTRSELEKRDEEIAAYKRAHMWQLPDQLQANMELLSEARERANSLTNDIQLREDRLASLRSDLRLRRTVEAATGVPASEDPVSRRAATLRSELAQLRLKYTDENPAVKSKKQELDEFLRENPEAAGAEGRDGPVADGGVGGTEIARLEAEIRKLEAERSRVQHDIDMYRERIADTPTHQQELSALTRDYDTLKKEFEETLGKRQQAQRAQELELSRQSEQFDVQDRAKIPSSPFKPRAVLVMFFSVVIGLALGIGSALLLELFDPTVRTEEEFKSAFPRLALLASIPNLDATVVAGNGRSRRRGSRSVAMLLLPAFWSGIAGTLLGG